MPDQSFIAHEEVEGVHILTPSVRLKSLGEDVVGQAAEGLMEVLDLDPPRFVLNLKNVEFFGSSFIEVLFRIWNRVKSRDGRLALCCVNKYCREVLDVTNLSTIWPIVDDRAAAIKAVHDS